MSIDQFVGNIKGDRTKAMDIILSNELLLMQQLDYYLTVHNPFRPIEGFLIDIKTRCSMVNPDRLRAGIDEFIDKAFLTDACLLFAPSQLALAAVLNAASKEQENLDSYVTGSLFRDARDQLKDLVDAVKSKLNMSNAICHQKNHYYVSLNHNRNTHNGENAGAATTRSGQTSREEIGKVPKPREQSR